MSCQAFKATNAWLSPHSEFMLVAVNIHTHRAVFTVTAKSSLCFPWAGAYSPEIQPFQLKHQLFCRWRRESRMRSGSSLIT